MVPKHRDGKVSEHSRVSLPPKIMMPPLSRLTETVHMISSPTLKKWQTRTGADLINSLRILLIFRFLSSKKRMAFSFVLQSPHLYEEIILKYVYLSLFASKFRKVMLFNNLSKRDGFLSRGCDCKLSLFLLKRKKLRCSKF